MSVKLGEALVYLFGESKGLEDDLKDSEKKTTSWAQNLSGKVGGFLGGALKVGVAGAAAAVVGIGTAAFAAGMQMDEAMDTIAISTGATGEALEGLGDDFRAVFRSIPTDAESASGALGELNKRLGLTGPALQDVSKNVLEASRLMGTDATKSAEGLSQAMLAWGADASTAAGTMDMFFVASQKSGVGMDQLMSQVQSSAPMLKGLGFTMEESIALFANFSKAGVDSGTAMTGLRTAAAAFSKEGVPLQQGLADVTSRIQGAKTDSEALSIAFEVFGARAGPAMVTAIRSGAMSLDDMNAALGESQGAIAATADATADFPEKFAVFKNVASTALAPLGIALMDVATTLLEMLGPAILQVAAWAGPAFEALGTAVSMVFDVLRGTGGDIPWEDILPGWAADAAYAISGAFAGIAGTVGGFISSLSGAQGQMTGISSALAGMGAPVSGLGAAFQTVAGIVSSVASQIGPILYNIFVTQMQTALAVATTVWGTIANVISTVVPVIITLMGMIAERAVPVLVQAFQIVQQVVSDVAGFVVPLVQQIAQLIQEQFGIIVAWVQANMPLIQATMDTVFGAIKVGLGVLLQVWNTVWPVMKEVVIIVFNIIKTAVETAVQVLLNIVKLGMQLITGDWEGAWETFKTIITTALTGVLTIVEGLLADVGAAIGGKVGEWLTLGADLVGGLVKGIQDNAGKVLDTMLGMVKNGVDAVKSFFGIKSPSKVMIQIGENLMGGLTIGIEGAGAQAVAAMKSVVVDLAKMIKDLASAFHQMNKVEKTEGGLPNLQLWANALYESIILFSRAIAEAAAEVKGKVLSKAKSLVGDLEQMFEMLKGFGALLVSLAAVETIPDMAPFGAALKQAIVVTAAAILEASLILGDKALKAAAKLTEAAEDILGIVDTGVRAVTAVAGVAVEQLAGIDVKWALVQAGMLFIVGALASIASTLDMTGYPAAEAFSESAGKIIALIEPAVRNILALAGVKLEDLQGVGVKWSWVETALLYIVGNLVAIVARLDQSGYPAAVAFSESAGKIIGLVEPGVNMVLALAGVKLEDLQGVGVKWSWVATAILIVAQNVTLIAARLGDDVLGAAEKFKTLCTSIYEAVKAGVGTLTEIGGSAGPESIAGAVGTLADSVKAGLEAAIAALRTGLDRMLAILRPVPGEIREIFSSFDWGGIGKGVADGIATGIRRGAAAIKAAAREAALAALEAAKQELGIASPSAVMREQVGRQAGLGVALGVRDMIPEIRNAMADLSGQMGGGGTGVSPYAPTSGVDLGETNGLLGQMLANLRALVSGVQALQPAAVMDARALARQLEFEARMGR